MDRVSSYVWCGRGRKHRLVCAEKCTLHDYCDDLEKHEQALGQFRMLMMFQTGKIKQLTMPNEFEEEKGHDPDEEEI